MTERYDKTSYSAQAERAQLKHHANHENPKSIGPSVEKSKRSFKETRKTRQLNVGSEVPTEVREPSVSQKASKHQCISDEAYFLAERRGFAGNHALDDWLEAERRIDDSTFRK